ncbi:TraR/DksA family transcriptional regulator [Pseudidiomarina sp. 1APP75-32.1]|uniref:TraR/DksA family transcriptional regulator n=1 Tax=Pseudidiomarina terrestris TaxID=2820060 RepID=A0AAW7R1I7_9GAMM|nr:MULTISPECIES: TraR/DksA family transcriptional regulator [unclassified Pseudidiomarina]MDN7124817.1 TraR/DksA family transcriptional regulator [Pseudidiomarina sp. 1APP75-32.1]MDN7129709.1 TraR/DksA family transcriptional regulator [Pseudidiomarina sp. 1APR75-15]
MSESLSAQQLLRIRSKLEAVVNGQSEGPAVDAAQAALQRLRSGEYGYCVECGDEISAARLAAKPDVALCVDCQALQDEDEDV